MEMQVKSWRLRGFQRSDSCMVTSRRWCGLQFRGFDDRHVFHVAPAFDCPWQPSVGRSEGRNCPTPNTAPSQTSPELHRRILLPCSSGIQSTITRARSLPFSASPPTTHASETANITGVPSRHCRTNLRCMIINHSAYVL